MAYGTNGPFGLRPSVHLNGSLWNGATAQYVVDQTITYSTSIFIGDPVVQTANGTIVSLFSLTKAGAPPAQAGASTLLGVFNGVRYIDANGNPQTGQYWQYGTPTKPNTYVLADIVDSPDVLYDVQSSIFTNLPAAVPIGVTATQIGNNGNLSLGGGVFDSVIAPNNPTNGSIISGQSGVYLDIATIASGNPTFTVKIVRFTPQAINVPYVADNAGAGPGDGNFNNVLVLLNNHVYKGGTGTAGV